ncbi:MAG: hypothetical protein IJV71_04155, partial [Lachnospiraceae bacterium]|nr:hypothetical protein [Lachnospiraceae bacterium]
YFAWITSSGTSEWFDNGGTYREVLDWNNQMTWYKWVYTNTYGNREAYLFPTKYISSQEIWYYEGVVDQKTGSHTEYRYRTRSLIYTLYLRAYGDWKFSSWSDTKPTETDTCRVNGTRTVY